MNYIIIDLEFNQPFDFTRGVKIAPNPNCPFEIIQIGAVKMNDSLEILGTGDFLIKPSLYKRVHPYVKKITGIETELLENQEPFTQVFGKFVEFIGSDKYVFCVWGGYDIKALFNNMSFHKISNCALQHEYIDVQQLASKKLNYSMGMHIGLKNAIESFHLEISASFHYALNDAIYTAKIFEQVFSQNMPVQAYTNDSSTPSPANYAVNTNSLYRAIEKEYGRQLTKKERKVFLKAYNMGRNREFDSKQKNPKPEGAV